MFRHSGLNSIILHVCSENVIMNNNNKWSKKIEKNGIKMN